jgi:hypothetical protein
MTVDMMPVDLRLDFRDMKIGILYALSALKDDGGTDQPRGVGKFSEIAFDLRSQGGLALMQGFVEDHQDLRHLSGLSHERFFQYGITQPENVSGEENPVLKGHRNGPFDQGHAVNVKLRRRMARGNLSGPEAMKQYGNRPTRHRGMMASLTAVPDTRSGP